MEILKFSRKFQILIGFLAKTRKNLPAVLLISFRSIKDFQYLVKLTLIFIKIGFSIKTFLVIHKTFKKIAGFH